MKPRPKAQDSGTQELFRAKLRNIINLGHELVRLGELIDWGRLEIHFAPYYREAGRPGLPIRLVVGLHLLKHIEGLSDEAVCERWERDPYMQYFCGEEYFQHAFPLERSGMTHFRKRVGEEALETLLQETLAAAYRGGALNVRATEAVAVDTTVQEKAIAHPTEHGLLLTALEQLGRQAKKTGLRLRQSYVRVARRAAMKTGRYLHAQQKRRAKRQVKFLRVRWRRCPRWRNPPSSGWNTRWDAPGISRTSSAAIEGTSIPGTRRKPNASARAKRARPMNSAAKFPSSRICIRPRAGTSSCRRARCTAIRTMVTR
jgi:IS5 family transposase